MRVVIWIVLLWGIATPASAKIGVDAALDLVRAEPEASRDVALIVAIEDYDNVPDIPGARANARLWRQWFGARGVTDVRVIEDADATHQWGRDGKPRGLLRHIDKAVNAARRSKGTLWFVFIGHGAPVFRKGAPQGVLLGHGVQQSADSLETNGIFIEADLIPRLGRARNAVAVLDACFSGRDTAGDALVPGLQPLIPASGGNPESVTVITAAKGSQVAGSLPGANRPAFSYLMLAALAGLADGELDRRRDQRVTSAEAFEWVKAQMAIHIRGRRQTPTLRGPDRPLSKAWIVQPSKQPAATLKATAAVPKATEPSSAAREVRPASTASVRASARSALASWSGKRKRSTKSAQRTPPPAKPGDMIFEASLDRPALRYLPAGPGAPALLMMQTEVTQKQWAHVMRTRPALVRCADCPVARVSIYDAIEYANRLSRIDGLTGCYVASKCRNAKELGKGCEADWCTSSYACSDVTELLECTGYRLPTSIEWQHALTSGTDGVEQYKPLHETAWYNVDGKSAWPVAQKRPNAWGLYDLVGNVMEWCFNPNSASRSMAHGASWFSDSLASRAYPSARRMPTVGFRLVRAASR